MNNTIKNNIMLLTSLKCIKCDLIGKIDSLQTNLGIRIGYIFIWAVVINSYHPPRSITAKGG